MDARPSTSSEWCRGAFTFDDVPLLLAAPRVERDPVVVADQLRSDGLNLVGYFTRNPVSAMLLGDFAKPFEQAGVAHSTIATQRTASPTRDAVDIDNRVEFTNTVCVVTADQFPFLASDFPELFAATERMIGYWFWELEHIPLHMRRSIALVDEIWAGSRFVTDAFAAVVVGARTSRADTDRRTTAVESRSRRLPAARRRRATDLCS